MKKLIVASTLLVLLPGLAFSQNYAANVISFNPGNLPSSIANYTNASAVLGIPSQTTPGPFGGPVDPFNPPYLNTQLVAIGTNGSLVVEFAQPIFNNPANPFGLDFIIFGNTGFIITNGNFSGGGITDGSTFGHNPGTTLVSVSADNLNFFPLNPSLAPRVDGLYPTEGSGSFEIPVNPALQNGDFAGKDLAGIRALYNGSAGGSGYDLNWADSILPPIRFIRVEVTDGVSEIDGFAAVTVPEPSTLLLGFAGLLMVCQRQYRLHPLKKLRP